MLPASFSVQTAIKTRGVAEAENAESVFDKVPGYQQWDLNHQRCVGRSKISFSKTICWTPPGLCMVSIRS